MGYSPQGRKESDTTERLQFHFTYDNPSSASQGQTPRCPIRKEKLMM